MTNFIFYALYPDRKVELLKDVGFEDLPRENFKGIEATISGTAHLLTVHLDDPRQRPIFAKRGFVQPGIDMEKSNEPVIYLMGWRMKIGDEVIQSINYICDWMGRGFQIHSAGKFRDDHPWFYTPRWKKIDAFEGEEYYEGNIRKIK